MALKLLFCATCALGSRLNDEIFSEAKAHQSSELVIEEEICNPEEKMELDNRLQIGPNHDKPCRSEGDWGDFFFYSNPKAPTTFAVYLYPVEDHNGAFNLCHGGQFSPTFCNRLLKQSDHYSVLFQRVETVEEAMETIAGLSENIVIKHLVLGGHGHPEGIEWGSEDISDGDPELSTKGEATEKFLDMVYPHLQKGETEYSTVFLDSCLNGANICYPNMLQHIAHKLAGVKVFASKVSFSETMIDLKGDGKEFDGKIVGKYLKRNLMKELKFGDGSLKDWKMDAGMYCDDMKKKSGVKTLEDCHKACEARKDCGAFVFYKSEHTVFKSKQILGSKLKVGHKKCFLSPSCETLGKSKAGALIFFKPQKD